MENYTKNAMEYAQYIIIAVMSAHKDVNCAHTIIYHNSAVNQYRLNLKFINSTRAYLPLIVIEEYLSNHAPCYALSYFIPG